MTSTQGSTVQALSLKRDFPSRSLIVLIAGLLFISIPQTARAQWQDSTYTLKGGWNAIYLHGEATYADPDALFSAGDALNIVEIWRWNQDPATIQFTDSPLIPSAGTPEWSVWKRGLPAQSSLTQMIGQTAYLIKCAGTTANTYSITITNRPLPPSATWVRNGANLIGFPTSFAGASYPTVSDYFITYPAAIAANSKIYKYIGGDLGPSNPIRVFSPLFEPLDRTQAYWFEAEVTGEFYGPLEVRMSGQSGLNFGRTGSSMSIQLRNRTANPMTVTLSPVSSAAAPASQTAIEGDVPLTLRTYNAIDLSWTETPITGPINQVIGPQSTVEVTFGINRAAMTGTPDALYASLLRITESGDLMDVTLSASALVTSLAGLWVGEATVSEVESKVATSPGTTTPRSFPLRVLLHIDDSGEARLLSQAFIGTLDEVGSPTGLCTLESHLKQDEKATARRITVAHMPLDTVIDGTQPGNSGSAALGSSLVRTVTIPYTDPTNPFVHQYHPDHDNKDARPDGTSTNFAEGVESYTIDRECTFDFTLTPPAGTSSLGWGSTVIGGSYTEILSGLHKDPLTVSGTFILQRVSEIGSITLN